MRRAAVYCRYSSENQRETSIDDQIASCRRDAAARGFVVLDDHVYVDRARPEPLMIGRAWWPCSRQLGNAASRLSLLTTSPGSPGAICYSLGPSRISTTLASASFQWLTISTRPTMLPPSLFTSAGFSTSSCSPT